MGSLPTGTPNADVVAGRLYVHLMDCATLPHAKSTLSRSTLIVITRQEASVDIKHIATAIGY